MDSREHTFRSRDGQEFIEGKSHYPDFLRLKLTTDDAWHVVHRLLTQLKQPTVCEVELFGELQETEEE